MLSEEVLGLYIYRNLQHNVALGFSATIYKNA